MPIHDNLGTRMKIFYEQIPKTKLMRRTPVIIRIDGKAFHTFTKGFKRPFDEVLIKTMQETTKYLCENIQGCVLGYTQSDEISLVLVDYKKFETAAWFDYEIQKMCSIAASMATMAFNKFFSNNIQDFSYDCCYDPDNENFGDEVCYDREYDFMLVEEVYLKAYKKGAMFDARVFNLPKEEVTNYFYWRQLDCSKNSIQMVGRAFFSHKELQNKSCNDIQDMLMTQMDINWNDSPTYHKRGSCVVRNQYISRHYYSIVTGDNKEYSLHDPNQPEHAWIIDKEIPIFKGEGRRYIEELIMVGE